MRLIEGGFARLFGAALAVFDRPATLHRVAHTRLRGGSVTDSVTDIACRVQAAGSDERMRRSGAAEGELRLRVPAASLTGPVTSDDLITVGGVRYAIAAVERDPAGVCFELRVRRG